MADITQIYKPHRQRLTDPQLVTDLLWNDIVDFLLSIVDLRYISNILEFKKNRKSQVKIRQYQRK